MLAEAEADEGTHRDEAERTMAMDAENELINDEEE
jgi:hypothetical protein